MSVDISNYLENYRAGKPVVMGKENFTPEFQEEIINNHFNFGRRDLEERQPQGNTTNDNSVSISKEELEKLRNYEKIARDPRVKDAFNPTPTYEQRPTQQVSQPTNNTQPANEGQSTEDTSSDNWLDNMFGNNTQTETQTQPPVEPDRDIRQQPQSDDKAKQMITEFNREITNTAIDYGLDRDEFANFVQGLSFKDYANMYVTQKRQTTQAQEPKPEPRQPVNLSSQQAPKKVSTYKGLDMYNRGALKNTLFG